MNTVRSAANKLALPEFLAANPFSYPLTIGFFYREKMRALHRVAPDLPLDSILEVGGGQSGLSALLYPRSQVVNIDLDPSYARSPCNLQPRVRFVCADATALPFADCSFDAVTMFDVLEHIPDHKKAVLEALRVLKPGGYVLLSSPNERWRFPYYGFMRALCPSDAEVMAEWGHVRRGYALDELRGLIGLPCLDSATFIGAWTVLGHDISFSRLSERKRRWLCAALGPITWGGYWLHRPRTPGTETASVWQKGRQ